MLLSCSSNNGQNKVRLSSFNILENEFYEGGGVIAGRYMVIIDNNPKLVVLL